MNFKPRTTRALWETGAVLSLAMARYWSQYQSFTEDWQFGLTVDDQAQKLFSGQGLRFDSNTMTLNWTHALAGAVYYSAARTNGLRGDVSTAFSIGGALVWEYVGEYREIASINDIIFTGVGGAGIGETMFQVGNHFRNRPGKANRVATWVFNPLLGINDLLDGKERRPREAADDWHDFRFAVGGRNGALTAGGATVPQTQFNLDMRLVTLGGYGKPGRGSGYSRDPIDATFHLDFNFRDGKNDEFNVVTKASIGGWWKRNVGPIEQESRRGYDMWLGLQIAWDMMQRRAVVPYDGHDLGIKVGMWFPRATPTQFSDKIASLHLPGPAFSFTGYRGRLRGRFDLQAAVDFSLVNAYALNSYSATHDIWGIKTTLHNWGYYYAYGGTAAARAEIDYRIVNLSAGADYRQYRSLQGLDRYQAQLIDDAPARDSRLMTTAAATIRVPRSPVFSTVSVERIFRTGQFHDVTTQTTETRVACLFGVNF